MFSIPNTNFQSQEEDQPQQQQQQGRQKPKRIDDGLKNHMLYGVKEFLTELNEMVGNGEEKLLNLMQKAAKMLAQQSPANLQPKPQLGSSEQENPFASEADRLILPNGDFEDFEEFLEDVYKESQTVLKKYLPLRRQDAPEKTKKLEDEFKQLIEAKRRMEEKNKFLEKSKEKLGTQLDESLETIDNLKKQLYSLEKNMSKLIENNQKLDLEKKSLNINLREKMDNCEESGKQLKEIMRKTAQREKEMQYLSVEKKRITFNY